MKGWAGRLGEARELEGTDSSELNRSAASKQTSVLVTLDKLEQNIALEMHDTSRNTIERSFGVWKRRFPVLANILCLKLVRVEFIIVACAVLHNTAIVMKDEEPPVEPDIQQAVDGAIATERQEDSLVYETSIESKEEELVAWMLGAADALQHMPERVRQAMTRRCRVCIDAGGRTSEQFSFSKELHLLEQNRLHDFLEWSATSGPVKLRGGPADHFPTLWGLQRVPYLIS
ncbi:hypothetical protein ANN_06192 [Periplaneta americana]|uniref:DDE Tnp4 domain-containing protein n=1 Tax=Periplaneta americana TaxID=6978 RepID=A0ABQ8TCX2_PERAM|nr:hypothetical protein ANN_06192 [Periplaneta americana]